MAKETKVEITCDGCGNPVEGDKSEIKMKKTVGGADQETEADLCWTCTKRMDSYLRRGCPKIPWSTLDA